MFKKVTFRVKGIKGAIKEIDKMLFKDELAISKLADKTRDYMKNLIYSRRRGGDGVGKSKLAESIKSERVGGKKNYTYGVGRISQLPKYWLEANNGLVVPGKKFGYFPGYRAPDPSKAGTGVGTEKFTSERGGFYLKPENPAKPLNYIEDTFTWVVTVTKIKLK